MYFESMYTLYYIYVYNRQIQHTYTLQNNINYLCISYTHASVNTNYYQIKPEGKQITKHNKYIFTLINYFV